MSFAWQEHDFEAERRQEKLSQSQPRTNWTVPIAWGSALLVSLALWRGIVQHPRAAGVCVVGVLGIGFVLPYALAAVAWVVSAIRGESGGTGI